MHPAFSVIFLTTLIGAGQGLFLALFTGQFYDTVGLLDESLPVGFYSWGIVLVMLLMGLGLFASFFHLGRPERAWRTATMWRTSWLSREVIVLPAFTGMAFIWGVMHFFDIDPVLATVGSLTFKGSFVVGGIATVLAFLLYISTGMIYAAVKFIQEWATPLTVINYTILGMASGFMLATALSAGFATDMTNILATFALLLTLLGFATRVFSLHRNKCLKHKSTASTAIGVRHPNITQISQGAMGGSFNTREFFHHKNPQFLASIKSFFLIATFIVPFVLLVLGWSNGTTMLLVFAVLVQYVGLVAERWFFFAQANHPQNLYYQAT